MWLWILAILGSGIVTWDPSPSKILLGLTSLGVFAFSGVSAHSLRGFKMKSMDYADFVQLALSGLVLVLSLKGVQEAPEVITSLPEDGMIAGVLVFFLIRWGSKGIRCHQYPF